MKQQLKNIVPTPIRRLLHGMRLWILRNLNAGDEVYCICCDRRYARFLPMKVGSHPRNNAICPGCGSAERHRMFLNYLKENETHLFKGKPRLLYVAPMIGIRNYLKSVTNIEYLGADLESALAEAHFDLQEIPEEYSNFDFIICSHTLAHIPNDRKAVSEIHRVLNPGGRLIIMERIYDREKTLEVEGITTEEERLKVYEQADRWRIYGRDFAERISSHGFTVSEISYGNSLSEEKLNTEGIDPKENIFICIK